MSVRIVEAVRRVRDHRRLVSVCRLSEKALGRSDGLEHLGRGNLTTHFNAAEMVAVADEGGGATRASFDGAYAAYGCLTVVAPLH